MCRQLYQHEIEGLQANKDQLEREVQELQTETQMNEQEIERGLRDSKAWSVGQTAFVVAWFFSGDRTPLVSVSGGPVSPFSASPHR